MRIFFFLLFLEISALYLENRRRCPLDVTVHYLAPHEFDCTKFYQCSNGILVEMSCGEGLYFDFELQICNWPDEVFCEDIFHESKLKIKNSTHKNTEPPFLISTLPSPNPNKDFREDKEINENETEDDISEQVTTTKIDDIESNNNEYFVKEDTSTDSNLDIEKTTKILLENYSNDDGNSETDEITTTVEPTELNKATNDNRYTDYNKELLEALLMLNVTSPMSEQNKSSEIEEFSTTLNDYITDRPDLSKQDDSLEKPVAESPNIDENLIALDVTTVNTDTDANINVIPKPTDNLYHLLTNNEIDHNKITTEENISNTTEIVEIPNTVAILDDTANNSYVEETNEIEDISSVYPNIKSNDENVTLNETNLLDDRWITNTEIKNIIVIKPTAIERTSIIKVVTTEFIIPQIYRLLYGYNNLDTIQPTIEFTDDIQAGSTKYTVNIHPSTEIPNLRGNYSPDAQDIQPSEVTDIQISTTCIEKLIPEDTPIFSTAEWIQPSTSEYSNLYTNEYTPLLKLYSDIDDSDNEIIHRTKYTTVIQPTTTEYTYTIHSYDKSIVL